MTEKQLATALRAFCTRKPFRSFFVEFLSGDRFLVPHPEAIHQEKGLYVFISPKRHYRLFAASSVGQLLDDSSHG